MPLPDIAANLKHETGRGYVRFDEALWRVVQNAYHAYVQYSTVPTVKLVSGVRSLFYICRERKMCAWFDWWATSAGSRLDYGHSSERL